MTPYAIPEALSRIRAAIDAGVLSKGSWGDGTSAVCMMSAAVTGAKSTSDCVTQGWPGWLADLNVSLFDSNIGADDETKARNHFALDVAEAVSVPRNFDKARDLFLIATLERSKAHDTANVTQPVIDLLRRRITGDDVADGMKAAFAAAQAAQAAAYVLAAAAEHAAAAAAAEAEAAASADAYAACAAYAAADAAVSAAYADKGGAFAAYAANRAAFAAFAAARVDNASAHDAADAAARSARADLIKAIKQS